MEGRKRLSRSAPQARSATIVFSGTPALRAGAASIALAGAGLLAALAVALIGRAATPSGGDVTGVAAEVDALVREAAAAVQARADTLAQLPRLGWAVATDAETVRDMTTEELAFRTRPGEHIEIANLPKGGGEVRPLLRLPPDASFAMPMVPGVHLFLDGGKSHVVAVVAVEPRQRADELTGLLAVSRELDTAAIEQRLEARGVHAALHSRDTSVALGARTPAPGGTRTKAGLASPAASGVELSVVWPGGRPAWTTVVPLAIALLSLLGAALLWWRKAQHEHAATAPLPAPATMGGSSPDYFQPEEATQNDPAPPGEEDAPDAEWSDPDAAKTDPVVAAVPDTTQAGTPTDPPDGAIPVEVVAGISGDARRAHHSGPIHFRMDPSRSGRVDISLSRSGSVAFPGERNGPARRASTPTLGNDSDPRNEEYKALFTEFMRLRRTTGEAIEHLDVVDFVEALRDKRVQLIRELGVKDVRFRLAFDNGKAAIRYMTVTAPVTKR